MLEFGEVMLFVMKHDERMNMCIKLRRSYFGTLRHVIVM